VGNDLTEQLDSQGRRIELTDQLGHVYHFEYDGNGNLTKTTFPDGTTRTSTYDLAGRRIADTDQAGRTTQLGYDALGRLTSTTDALGEVTAATYDEVGNQITQTDAEGRETRLEYDALGRLTKRIRPLGQEESFAYDANGNQITHTDFNGETTTFVYDADDRLTQKNLPGGAGVSYDYAPSGLRTQAGGDSYEYDARGRLTMETKASGDVLVYTYDDAGNRSSVTTPEGTATYTSDELNRLSTVVDATGTTTYTYDAAGNPTSTTHPNGVTTTNDYDTLNRLVQVTNENIAGLLSSYAYTLEPAGNRARVVESGPATTGRTVTYTYDAVYRLTQEDIDEAGAGNDQTITYAHDAVGNRLEVDRDGSVTTYAYDDNDLLLSETTGGATTTYAYDDNGNMIGRTVGATTDTYVYDAENRLLGANLQTGPTIGAVSYTYDTDGIRTSATRGGLTTTFVTDKTRDVAQVLVERTGADVVAYTYGLDLVSQVRSGGGASFHLYDGQLSTRQLTDGTGAVTDSYTYDAFGALSASTGSSPNFYLYAGEQLDPDLGFYYLRARYYDQGTGRFTATDPRPGDLGDPSSLHRYLYAAGDPINKADPSGEFVVLLIPIIIGLVALFDYVFAPAQNKGGKGRTDSFRLKFCSGGQVGLIYTAGWREAVIAEDVDERLKPRAAKYTLSLHGIEVGGILGGSGESDTIKFPTKGPRKLQDFAGTGSLHSVGVSVIFGGYNRTTMKLPEGTDVETETGFGWGINHGLRLSAGVQAVQVDWDLVDDESSRYLSGGNLFCK
jgi:RHS repeat-associated protein